jgi:hypothetical protein
VVVLDDDGGSGAPTATTTAAAATTAAASSTAPTTVAPTTTATTIAAAVAAPEPPATPEQLIALFAADPGRYGSRIGELVDRLGEIDNRGRRARQRAGALLDEAAAWTDNGELTPEAYALVESVLGPLADQGDVPGGDDDEDDD